MTNIGFGLDHPCDIRKFNDNRMNKYTVLLCVFCVFGLVDAVQAQDTKKCSLDYLELKITKAGKISNLNVSEFLSSENLPNIKLVSSKKLDPSYLKKISIEVILAKETQRMSTKVFVGIDHFNAMNSLASFIPLKRAEPRNTMAQVF